MEQFRDAVWKRDAADLRTSLAAHPEPRTGMDRPVFSTEPAIVFWHRERAAAADLSETAVPPDSLHLGTVL